MHSARRILIACLSAGAISFLSTGSGPQAAASLTPQSMDIELEPLLAGLNSPLLLTNARDGSGRLFIVEQPGRILVVQPGQTAGSVFLDLTPRVVSGGERGLLGLAFHPQFVRNRRFFVDYTRRSDGATVIAEYHASPADPNTADSDERVLLVIPQPFGNHNGGMIEFGPDRDLYIGMGDGGSANDPNKRAQNTNELLGKMLRIDADRSEDSLPYASPSDNPFFGSASGRNEIYAVGLRNPFRFSFDRTTGELYAGDVGQNAVEEADIITRGGNFGWRVFEGSSCTNLNPQKCARGGFIGPIAEYDHSGGRCSIIGGYVYRGARSTLPLGSYVYGDFCSGEIFLLQGGSSIVMTNTPLSISSFGEDESGELYVVGLGGTVHRIVNRNPPTVPVSFTVTSATVRKRKNGKAVQVVRVARNGRKLEVVITEAASVPAQASQGATVFANGVGLATTYTTNDAGEPVFVGRLGRFMLAYPGQLTLEVVRTNGERSNALPLQVSP